jgi:hypothetical protein
MVTGVHLSLWCIGGPMITASLGLSLTTRLKRLVERKFQSMKVITMNNIKQ